MSAQGTVAEGTDKEIHPPQISPVRAPLTDLKKAVRRGMKCPAF